MSPEEFASYLKQNQDNPKERNLVLEVSGAALSCGAAALSWLVVIGTAGTIPLTAGTTSPLTYLSTSAAIASTIQCVNGGLRTYNEISGNTETNDELDSNQWYVTMSYALDVISLAGAETSYAMTIKAAKLTKKSTGKSYIDTLKGLNRADRKRLTEEVIRMQNPNVNNTLLKKYMQSGTYPKRYSNFGIKRTYVNQLKDAIGASLSFTGSALSGVVNGMTIGVWENAHDK